MAKKKPSNVDEPTAVAPGAVNPVNVPAAPAPASVPPAHDAATCKACHDLLMEIHNPDAPKSALSRQLIDAKKKLDAILGIMPTGGADAGVFGAEPFGGSNIIGTEIHQKWAGGVPSDQFCITVFVKQKAPKDALIFGKIPEAIDGIPTDISVIGEANYQATNAGGEIVGTTMTNGVRMTGTIGALVNCSTAPGAIFILSNQHVMNASNISGNFGQDVRDPLNQKIGELAAWSTPTHPTVDAGIAVVTNAALVSSTYVGGGFTLDPNPIGLSELVSLAQATGSVPVKKLGKVTGLTHGLISPNPISVGAPGRLLQQQYRITCTSNSRFSEDGDSGSLIVHEFTNRPIGLLWGGDNSDFRVSYANQISLVQGLFSISQFL